MGCTVPQALTSCGLFKPGAMAPLLTRLSRISPLSRTLLCNLYGPPLAQLQRQREVGAVGSRAVELDRPGAPAHAHRLSAAAGHGDARSLSLALWGISLRELLARATIQDPCQWLSSAPDTCEGRKCLA